MPVRCGFGDDSGRILGMNQAIQGDTVKTCQFGGSFQIRKTGSTLIIGLGLSGDVELVADFLLAVAVKGAKPLQIFCNMKFRHVIVLLFDQ